MYDIFLLQVIDLGKCLWCRETELALRSHFMINSLFKVFLFYNGEPGIYFVFPFNFFGPLSIKAQFVSLELEIKTGFLKKVESQMHHAFWESKQYWKVLGSHSGYNM